MLTAAIGAASDRRGNRHAEHGLAKHTPAAAGGVGGIFRAKRASRLPGCGRAGRIRAGWSHRGLRDVHRARTGIRSRRPSAEPSVTPQRSGIGNLLDDRIPEPGYIYGGRRLAADRGQSAASEGLLRAGRDDRCGKWVATAPPNALGAASCIRSSLAKISPISPGRGPVLD